MGRLRKIEGKKKTNTVVSMYYPSVLGPELESLYPLHPENCHWPHLRDKTSTREVKSLRKRLKAGSELRSI